MFSLPRMSSMPSSRGNTALETTSPAVDGVGSGHGVLPARAALAGVRKSFGATRALVDASLEIHAGEVHTVMGENGSGKSTLVKILSGVHRPDAGSLALDGVASDWLKSPSQTRRAGVSTVFQEVLTIPGRSILDNVWLNTKDSTLGKTERRQQATEVLRALLGRDVDLNAPVDELSLSDRQACCIARSLVTRPSLLILDESTAALDVATRDRLFGLLRELTAEGVSVLFISHRMDEVFAISDVVTVFRTGTTTASRIPIAETSQAHLVELMSDVASRPPLHRDRTRGQVLLRASDLRLAPDARPVDFELRAGELVGLAGLEGQGQDLFIKALYGMVPAGGGTIVRTDGERTVSLPTPRAARRNGVAYVPRERRREGLFEQLSIRENFGLPRLAEDSAGPLISTRKTRDRLDRFGGALQIKMGRASDPISTLSGGNQQKVLIARSLADAPKILLLNDPTRGIDHNAKHDLYELLLELCQQGIAVVFLSSEVDEIVDLADRALVFRDHSLSAHLEQGKLTRSNLVAAYFQSQMAEMETAPLNKEIS
jgi:ABC-type sugar transport system ATPase subunit